VSNRFVECLKTHPVADEVEEEVVVIRRYPFTQEAEEREVPAVGSAARHEETEEEVAGFRLKSRSSGKPKVVKSQGILN
jgi:hypothetical protein